MDTKDYYKHYKSWDDYLYPNTNILKNKQNIKDFNVLSIFEYSITSDISEKISNENIDTFQDYCNLHYQLFNEIYDWAGEIRTVNMMKMGLGNHPSKFLEWKNIAKYGDELFNELVNKNYFIGYSEEKYFESLVDFNFKLNHIHPFREGNGRTQKILIQNIVSKNNSIFDYTKIDKNLINELSSAYELSLDGLVKNPEDIKNEMIKVFKHISSSVVNYTIK